MTGSRCTPRASRLTLLWFSLALCAAVLNAIAALASTPSEHLQTVGRHVGDGRLAPAIAVGTPWDLATAVLLIVLAWGILRRRRIAWAGAVMLFATLAAADLVRHEEPLAIAVPVAGAISLLLMRRTLVAEPYREILRRHQLPSGDALDKAAGIVRRYGTDTLAPFKLRPDVGHLFSTRGDAVLAYRVENRALLVAGDAVGSPDGVLDVVRTARDLARGAGLRFGIAAASESFSARMREELGMRSIYLGCEAIVSTADFTLEGRKIKKVRQAHRRVEREGYRLLGSRLSDLTPAERAAMRRCNVASRADDDEQSFSMAPDSLESRGLRDAIVFRAVDGEGRVGGLIVFTPLAQRSLWSLALQLRDPEAPNGVIDALLVQALVTAKEEGVEEVSLNFAAGRRYMHEPVRGFWPHVARILARIAMRWTQIDALRFHNEKFSPRWEQRFVLTDHVLHVPHLTFAIIWQEGQLPRPGALIAPAWPQTEAEARPPQPPLAAAR